MRSQSEYPEEDWLALSGLQHFAFCRRQWALIHIEQQWQENYLTTAGHLEHERAHDYEQSESRGDTLIMRDLRVFSRHLGITGACDVVEFHQSDDGVPLRGMGYGAHILSNTSMGNLKLWMLTVCNCALKPCAWRKCFHARLLKEPCSISGHGDVNEWS